MKRNPHKNSTPDDESRESDDAGMEITGSEKAIADALASVEAHRDDQDTHDEASDMDAESSPISSKLDALSSLMQKKDERLKEAHDRLVRLTADFENYKKRMEKERERFAKTANEALLRGLLPILDSFERTLEHADKTKENSAMIEGIQLVQRQVLDYLQKNGVKPIKALGEIFNPEFHEAIAQEAAPGAKPHEVLKELERGYLLYERLLRPAKVIVAAVIPAAGE